MLKRTVVLVVLAASLAVPGAASASHDFLPPTSYASAPPRTVYVAGTIAGAESSATPARSADGAAWTGAVLAAATLTIVLAGGVAWFGRRRRSARMPSS
ncbi:MAG: hypothetical protein U0R71_17470 [Solirubrobacterales bacterium]